MSYKDPEKRRAYMRKYWREVWLPAHREEHAESCRAWKKENRDHYNAYNREYYAEHRDDPEWRHHRQESTRKWRAKKREADAPLPPPVY